MIFGNVAYRGSLRRRSVVTTAGSFTRTVSKPPSISRVTVRPSSVFSNFDVNVAYNRIWRVFKSWNFVFTEIHSALFGVHMLYVPYYHHESILGINGYLILLSGSG